MSDYEVKIIDPEKREEISDELAKKVRYELKANIHGACVKLLTDNKDFKNEWEDNFKFMNEDLRPHSKIFCIDNGGELEVLYDPIGKVSIVKNLDYYGWVKSIALATISDFFEDYHSIHRRYSVHGSAVDYMGHALAIIGPPGTGKTTLTYGLLQEEEFNYISDDWFFVRLFSNATVLYSSEKNSYIRDDIADVWKGFADELNKVKLDIKGRGIADVNSLFGGRIRESSTLINVVLLERNKDNPPFRKVDTEEALNYMLDVDFCNPHQLIRNERKLNLRKNFFRDLFSKQDVYILNTIETPQESLNRIKNLAKVCL
ncbi:HPr kinase/phosphorylase [Methanobacterium sp. ACI-7]|uniref:HPr kinase/phosphorylase n=1 Tax=unclassified Methanobacterium TaxID=2627676 RepID=UPI0039C33DD6